MGRVKLELKRIENSTNRQITYSKRKKGLIKKAYELSTLCDIDLALLMFSPSDRLSLFSGQTRSLCFLPLCNSESIIKIPNQLEVQLHDDTFLHCWIEDVLARFINLPDQERDNAIVFPSQSKRQGIQNKEYLLRTLEQLKTENHMALQINEPGNPEAIHSDVKELEQDVCRLQQQLQISEEELRKFEPDPMRFTSMEEIEACETHLLHTLKRVVQRREHLLSKSCEATKYSTMNGQIILNDVAEGWEPEAEPQKDHYNSQCSPRI